MTTWVKRRWGRLLLGILALGGILAVSHMDEEAQATSAVSKALKVKSKTVKGIVTDGQARPIEGATVYLIGSGLIDTTTITPAGILDGTAEAFDEPLEDVVNDPAKLATLPFGVTNLKGQFSIKKVPANTKYFAYVVPKAGDTHLLPGGDASRTAFSVLTLPKKPGLAIKISWTQQNEPATYLGTTACLVCHSDYQENFKQHGHKLGLQVPGNRTALQDISSHPSFDDFLVKFTEAAAYTDPGVKVLFFEGYDSTRSFDKWKVLEDAPVGTPMVKVYLWKTSGTYKVTMENLVNAGDPPRTYTVALTYGGAVFKSRLLLSLPGRKGVKSGNR